MKKRWHWMAVSSGTLIGSGLYFMTYFRYRLDFDIHRSGTLIAAILYLLLAIAAGMVAIKIRR